MNIGLEYQLTAVQYGDYAKDAEGKQFLNAHALADQNLHWVGNHRVNLMVKYNF